jgi:replicative DNA helicase
MIFFSMEQQGVMAFERFMQMEGAMEGRDVEKWMIAGNDAHNSKIFSTAQNLQFKLKNLLICDQGGLTMSQIEANTRQAGFAYFGRPVSVIFIDYLGYIKGEGKDFYEKVSQIATMQKEVAKRLNCVVVSLHQTTKAFSLGDELTDQAGRDSSSVRDSADILITAWRPEFQKGKLESELVQLRGTWRSKIVKNRYGPANEVVDFTFIPQFLKLKEKENTVITDALTKAIGPACATPILAAAPGFVSPAAPAMSGGLP